MSEEGSNNIPVTAGELVKRINNALHGERQRVIWDGTRGVNGAWVLRDLKKALPTDVGQLATKLGVKQPFETVMG